MYGKQGIGQMGLPVQTEKRLTLLRTLSGSDLSMESYTFMLYQVKFNFPASKNFELQLYVANDISSLDFLIG